MAACAAVASEEAARQTASKADKAAAVKALEGMTGRLMTALPKATPPRSSRIALLLRKFGADDRKLTDLLALPRLPRHFDLQQYVVQRKEKAFNDTVQALAGIVRKGVRESTLVASAAALRRFATGGHKLQPAAASAVLGLAGDLLKGLTKAWKDLKAGKKAAEGAAAALRAALLRLYALQGQLPLEGAPELAKALLDILSSRQARPSSSR
eukprot:tig00000189_g14349.t1